MTCTRLAARIEWAALACVVSVAIASRASAQWADFRYQNRSTLTVANSSSHAFASGDLVTATLPVSTLTGLRPDGADVAIYQGATAVPAKLLPMGGTLKAILQLPSALPAMPAYGIAETLNAGKTAYASLPVGTRLAFADNADDAAITVTLPFTFPFKAGAPSNQLTISTDGYVTPGAVDGGRPDTLAAALTKFEILPYGSDFQITTAPSTGVYADLSNPAQATIRWEVYPSGGSAVVAKFALILKPNGDIRFVYGTPCMQDTATVYWNIPVYGVAVGDSTHSVVTDAATLDMGNHDDITYAVTIPSTPTQTFDLYYNGPSVTTGPTPPASVQSWDFSDGQMHGWRSHQDPTGNSDLSIVTDTDGVSCLRLDSSKETVKSLPWTSPGNMTPLGDQTVYWKVRRPDAPNTACFPVMRFNPVTLTDLNNLSYITLTTAAIGFQFGENYSSGGQLTAEYFTPADPAYADGRTPPNDHQFTNHTWTSNPVSTDSNQFFVTSCWDTNGTTMLGGKGWQAPLGTPTVGSDPLVGGYTMTWDTSSDSTVVTQPVAPGIIGWQHWTNSALLKWVCAIPGGFAERVTTGVAAAETAPAPGAGKAVLQGVAYDDSIGVTAPIGGLTLTVKDAANNVLATSVTDASGRYRYVINAGPVAAVVTISGSKPGSKGSATQSVVENNIYTVNVPIAFGSRASGIVYDPQTNGGIAGATVKLLTPGTSTVVFTATTDSSGRYGLDMDAAGTYDLAISAGSYTAQTLAGVTYPLRTIVTRDFGLIAPELLANGGFETEAPVVDPAGYPGALRPAGFTTFDQLTPAVTTAISNDVALLDDTLDTTETFYLNNASRSHSGTHCVAIKRTVDAFGTIIGSTSVQWMLDTGSLIPISPNQKYRVSLWVKGTRGMQTRARVRFHTTNVSSSTPGVAFTGSDTTFYADSFVGDWQQFSAIITAPSTPAFMTVRFYGNFRGTGTTAQVAYFDDVSVKAVSPRVIIGTTVDGSGAGVGGVVIGANHGRPGMTDPAFSAASSSSAGSVGAFALSLMDKGTFNVQTYRPGYIAGPQTTLDTTASYAVPVPITLLAPSTPAVNLAVASKASSTDATSESPQTFLAVPDVFGFDGSNVNRGNGQWSQWRSKLTDPLIQLPITVTADLGKVYTTSQLTWVWAWSGGGPRFYDVLTSEDGGNYTTAYVAAGTGGLVWTDSNGNTHSCISLPAPIKLRYVRMIFRSLDRLDSGDSNGANLGFSEFRVDAPAANVTGKVTKLDGTPVSGAAVGIRGGSGSMVKYGTTDATGAYTIALPTNSTVGLVAHYLPDGDNVVAITDPLDAYASTATTLTIPTIKVADPVTNLVPLAGVATTESLTDETGYTTAGAIDHVFTTRWSAYAAAQIRPDAPAGYIIDLGAPKTFNQVTIMWGLQFGGWYAFDVSNDGTTWQTLVSNKSNYSGYTYASDKFVDVQSLPTTTAQYVRVQSQWAEQQWFDMFEVQLANVTANPTVPFTLTKQALKIAAGLVPSSGADMTSLNVVTTGSSAAVINMADAISLAKQAK